MLINNIIIDKIWLDLDSEKSFENIKKLHVWCRKNNYKHLLIFSGLGFHFYIFTNKNVLKNPKIALKSAQIEIAKQNNLTIGEPKTHDIDEHIIGDIARVCSIPNTFNCRRKRYCIPITEEDLEKGLEFIREKAKKRVLKFKIYGTKLFDISRFDVDVKNDYYELAELDEEIEIEINKDKLLKNLPPLIAQLLLKKTPGWRDRFIIISYLRDSGYLLQETIQILKHFLTPEKFRHCFSVEHQPQYLYKRFDLIFPTNNKLLSEGYELTKKDVRLFNNLYK